MSRLEVILLLSALLAGTVPSEASVVYTYDFPGPSSTNGLAVNQTNPQPPNATFSDFTRQGGLAATDSNVFGSKNWTMNASIDLTQYEGFTVTADASYVLNLTQISFTISNPIDGPGDFQVKLFLNGSSTEYESSPDYATQGTTQTLTWDFTDLTTPDNTTTAEFRFYGWNTVSSGAHLTLDDVATSGSVALVPEPSNLWVGFVGILSALGCTCHGMYSRRKRAVTGNAGPN